MFDVLITGGTAVTPAGIGPCDVAIAGGRIVALAEPGYLTGAREEIVADGKLIIPGGIDPHVHCKWMMPDIGEGGKYSAGPDVVSRAALYGGTTTLIDFAPVQHDESVFDAIRRRDEDWGGQCYCDYSYHVMLQGDITPRQLNEVPAAIEAGFPSWKIFTTEITPSRQGRMISFGNLWELLQATAAANGIMAIHAEDNDLVMHMSHKLNRLGQTDYPHLPEVHSSLSEDLSFRRVIRLMEHVPQSAVYLMHVSAASGVSAIAEGRRRNLAVYGETLHQYALRTQDNYYEPDGMKYHTYPSLKTTADTEALWEGVRLGDIATFATDEICSSYADKVAGRRIDNVTGGNTGLEPRMAILYTEMVVKRGMKLERFVEATATNAAKIMGLYPRKGVLAVGSDADLVVLDPAVERTVTAGALHESDYTPWEGWPIKAWPVLTMLRGKIVVRDGVFAGSPQDGQRIYRQLDPEVRQRPL